MLTRSAGMPVRDHQLHRHSAQCIAGRPTLGLRYYHQRQQQSLRGISAQAAQSSDGEGVRSNASSSSTSSNSSYAQPSTPSASSSTSYSPPVSSSRAGGYSILLADNSSKRGGKQKGSVTSSLPERSAAEKEALAAEQEAAAQAAATAALTTPGVTIVTDGRTATLASVGGVTPAELASAQAAATPSGLLGVESVSVSNLSAKGQDQAVGLSYDAGLSRDEVGALAAGTAAAAATQAAIDDGLTEVSEVVEVVLPSRPQGIALVRSVGVDTHRYLTTNKAGQGISAALGVLLAGTFAMAVYRAWQKANTTRAQRLRQVDRNKTLVDGLNKYLPENRAGLTPGVARSLRGGFTPVEAFRKYLWFLLRERKFDQAAVDDMVHLKTALGLSDADTAEALRERAQRIYDKYGTLMINTEGMTMEGVQRKSTCRNLLRKLLYLIECGRLLPQPLGGVATADTSETTAITPSGAEASTEQALAVAAVVDLRTIFGATEADLKELRITNLYEDEVDLEAAMDKTSAADSVLDSDEDGPGKKP